jgi:hypothetical protein
MVPQRTPGGGLTGTPETFHVNHDDFAAHLPDVDPEETAEWLESATVCSMRSASNAPASSFLEGRLSAERLDGSDERHPGR